MKVKLNWLKLSWTEDKTSKWNKNIKPYSNISTVLHSQFSQCFPDVPAGHMHCPVTLSHGAPVQIQGWTQPGPNLPSGQSDTGQSCLNTGGQKTDGKGDLKDEESVSYPDHSSLHDDQEGIFSGTLQSHDHTTLLADRCTSSHSRRHKYPGCILETRQSKTQYSV